MEVSYTKGDLKKVYKFISEHPEVGAEALRQRFGVEPTMMTKLLRKLREQGFISAKGVTRAMKYQVTKKAWA